MAKGGRARPNLQKVKELGYDKPPNFDKSRPIFCLEHIDSGFSVKNASLTKEAKSAFAETLETLASLSWATIKTTGRHKLGMEKIPVGQLKLTMPTAFEDEDHVLVFRYFGKLPMAGVRRGATLHFIAIERQFGELYDHG